ncbi:hypothetical protein V2I01_32925 [Micromonospora sp. BRA006-A]|nr:hypothetical protein [Micromonospora sp. BRA006-A]
MIRAQAPLIAHVNDRAEDWATMWQRLVELGVIPYYMFVERDTGAPSPAACRSPAPGRSTPTPSGRCPAWRGPPGAGHVGRPGQGARGRRRARRRDRDVQPAYAPGPRRGPRRPAVLRPARPGGRVVRRPASRLRLVVAGMTAAAEPTLTATDEDKMPTSPIRR